MSKRAHAERLAARISVEDFPAVGEELLRKWQEHEILGEILAHVRDHEKFPDWTAAWLAKREDFRIAATALREQGKRLEYENLLERSNG